MNFKIYRNFSKNLCKILFLKIDYDFRTELGVSVEFLLPPMLSAISFYLKCSKVKAFGNFVGSFSLYTILLANLSTGKSLALNEVRDAVMEQEIFDEIEAKCSKLTNDKKKKIITFFFFFLIYH